MEKIRGGERDYRQELCGEFEPGTGLSLGAGSERRSASQRIETIGHHWIILGAELQSTIWRRGSFPAAWRDPAASLCR